MSAAGVFDRRAVWRQSGTTCWHIPADRFPSSKPTAIEVRQLFRAIHRSALLEPTRNTIHRCFGSSLAWCACETRIEAVRLLPVPDQRAARVSCPRQGVVRSEDRPPQAEVIMSDSRHPIAAVSYFLHRHFLWLLLDSYTADGSAGNGPRPPTASPRVTECGYRRIRAVAPSPERAMEWSNYTPSSSRFEAANSPARRLPAFPVFHCLGINGKPHRYGQTPEP
jgi:hypothetical protein